MKKLSGITGHIFLLMFLVTGLPPYPTSTTVAQSRVERPQVGAPFVPGRVLVQFRPETLALRTVDVIAETGASDTGEIAGTGVHIVELPAGADEQAFVEAFQSRQEVEFAELDRTVPLAEIVPDDPWYGSWEWYLTKISAPSAWSTTTGSSSITIAIIDSGVDGTHEDLASKMVPGWNVYNNNSDTSDVVGHGTSVAGTAAAATNNGKGVASIAWNCRIMPIRVTDTTGYLTWSNAASGLTWAADHGARVANISAEVSDSSTVRSAAQYFQSRGGVVTCSAGNEATFDPSADNPYILTVSATDGNDALCSWSNTGNNVDLSAPGTAYTTYRGGGYGSASGTSIAAPVVAGVAALVLSVNPSLTASQVQDILKQSADDRGSPGWDPSYGWGRVNAARAVSLAGGGGAGDTTAPTVSITSPSAGAAVSGTVSVLAVANDNVSVASMSLSVDGVPLGGDNTAPYAFTWNTTNVANGVHALTATATDAAGNSASASVSVTVNNFGDTTPPSVSITSPGNGANVAGNVSVLVSAMDNVGVVKVELYVDGSLTSTSISAPFSTKWNSRRATVGAHTLQSRAYDAAQNAGVSALVTVHK